MLTDHKEKYKKKLIQLIPVGKRFVPTRLRAGLCGVQIPAVARDVSVLVKLQTGCGPT
jgi:hypothetical protein